MTMMEIALITFIKGVLGEITWNVEEGSQFMAHFYKDGEYLEAKPFLIGGSPGTSEAGGGQDRPEERP